MTQAYVRVECCSAVCTRTRTPRQLLTPPTQAHIPITSQRRK